MRWLRDWIQEGRDLQRRTEETRERIADLLAQIQRSDAERWLDLNRVIAIKWGDKIIDPSEVVYVLREAK